MSNHIDLTTEKFEETVLGDGIVLLDFWAEWCGPCQVFGPIFEEAADEHPEITFAKVNTEVEQALSAGLAIQGIPTIMAFRDGVQVFRQSGALPPEALEDLINQIEALDMDEVHAAIAKHHAEEGHGHEDDEIGQDDDHQSDDAHVHSEACVH